MFVHSPAGWGRVDWAITGLLFVSSLALYTATLAPTINSRSFDSAELVAKSGLLQMAHTPGSPVFVWLGHLFTLLPFGEPATRVNWMSAFFGAVTVALLYAVIARHLTGERLSALGGAALFALSLTFWSQAVIAELYTPSMAFLAFTVLALLEWSVSSAARVWGDRWAVGSARWWLAAGAAAFGLSLGIHLSNVLYVPGFALFALLGFPVLRRTLRRGEEREVPRTPFVRYFDILGGAIAVLVGLITVAVPYAWVYVTLPQVPPGDFFPGGPEGWSRFYEVTLNAFSWARFAYTWEEIPGRVVVFLRLLWENLGPAGVVLVPLGIVRLLFTRPRPAILLLPVALANIVFYVNYKVPDNDVYYIPAYWALGCFAGGGLEAIMVGARALLGAAGWNARQLTRSTGAIEGGPGLQAAGVRSMGLGAALPALLAGAVLLVGVGWHVERNYNINDLSDDLSFRDFYGNVFDTLPQGAYLYHRGAAMGYDLLYYTALCGVRPDLHVQAGIAHNEPPPSEIPWPDEPVFSGTTKHDAWISNFIHDPYGNNHKWYRPVLTGMFKWEGGMQFGWLNLYSVRKPEEVPMDWMVSIEDPASRPQKKLDIGYTSLLSLVGVDTEPQARAGRPWRLVRYWYLKGSPEGAWLPPMVTVLGDHLAIESHFPLFGQFEDYVAARKIEDLGLYVIKDEINLVIPSNTPPGTYTVSNAMAEPQLMSLLVDPAPPEHLMSREEVMTTVEVVADPELPPPDPLAQAANGRCRR